MNIKTKHTICVDQKKALPKRRHLLFFVLVFFFPVFGFAQEMIKVSGKIVSEKSNDPLQNVEVSVKNSKNSTVTDKAGNYLLTAPSNATIVVRQKGYADKNIKIEGKNTINIALVIKNEERETNIDEVVLVGYTKVSKADVTNSISTVKSADIADMPVNSAAEAIQGRMAGVQVTIGEGAPGTDPEIKVRGGTSITQSNVPLYIVDGIQMENALSVISPKEIESIEVLKDASSTSIYGAQGANGVVLITTKSGKKNTKTNITYSGYTGVRSLAKELPVMSPYEYVMYQYEIYNIRGIDTDQNAFIEKYGAFSELEKYKTIQQKNWQKEVFGRKAFNFTNNLTITGGSNNSSFSLTLNHVEEDGIMLNSGFKRSMANFKYDYDLSKKVKIGLNARYGRTLITGSGTSNEGTSTVNKLRNIIRYQPYEGGVAYSGEDEFDPDLAVVSNLVNPVLLSNNELKYNSTNNLLLNAYLSYNITKDLTFKSVIGYVQNDRDIKEYWGVSTYPSRTNADLAVVSINQTQTRRITNTNTLNYKKKFGEHKIDLLLGQEIVKTDGETAKTVIKWLPLSLSPQEAFANIQFADPPSGMVQDKPTTAVVDPDRLSSFFARANYIYKNRYILTASIRRDGSSIFGPKNKWGTFPSASLAWKIAEENFLKEVKWVDELKLRVGYGQSGNNRIQPYLYDTFYVASSEYGYTPGTGISTGSAPGNIMANYDMKWEATVSQNAGIDFTFFNKRLYGSIDAYITDTKDLLLLAKIPQTSGYEYQYQNSGKTQNKGIEFTLGGIIANKGNFTWKADFNIAANKNIIKSLGSAAEAGSDYYLVSSGWVQNLFDFKAQVGQPLGTYFGYVTEGRYEISDFNYNASSNRYTLKEGIASSSNIALGNTAPQPGDLKLKDINGDGKIDNNDMTDLGSSQPKFYGGFNQTFKYRNFDLSLFFNFSVGNKVYNANKLEFTTRYQYKDQNMLADMENRWKWFDNSGVKITDPIALAALNANTTLWTPTGGNYFLHSYAIEDGSFLRLNNVTLGYSLPKGMLSDLSISNFRLYVTANNVFTVTGYSGYDPEVSTRKNPLTPGVDYAAYPRTRFFLTGIDITF